MNILVTGGAGYIGSHFVKTLGENFSHDITIIDNFSTGFKEAVRYGKLIQVDLNNLEKLEEIFAQNKFDVIVHFAANMVVPESVENPLKYYLNNTVNSLNLINLAVKYNVNKFIFSSTAAVYGPPKEIPVKETAQTNPINPYGRSKLIVEQALKDVANAHKDFKYIILRYFNVAGADPKGEIGQSTAKASHLVKVCAKAAIKEIDKVYIYGDDFDTIDGTGVRDYIHVQDLVDAHIAAIDYINNHNSDIFNCGYSRGFSVKDVIETMKKVSGVDFKTEITQRREGDPAEVVADNSKILEKMNWKPKYNDLNLICKTALDWEKTKNY